MFATVSQFVTTLVLSGVFGNFALLVRLLMAAPLMLE